MLALRMCMKEAQEGYRYNLFFPDTVGSGENENKFVYRWIKVQSKILYFFQHKTKEILWLLHALEQHMAVTVSEKGYAVLGMECEKSIILMFLLLLERLVPWTCCSLK